MRPGALSPALALAALAGCTPEARWGHEARYAPDFRGYVVARPGPERRFPGFPVQVGDASLTHRILVRNPITGEKIRCREQLDPYLAPITREAATVMHDTNAALRFTLPVAMTMPTTWAGSFFTSYVAPPLVLPSLGLEWLLSSPSADAMYQRGKRAFDAGRLAEAEPLFERALAKRGGASAEAQRSAYYLGVLYEREGRAGDAARAFRTFVARAGVRDEKAYDEAEERLAALDPAALAPCRSQAPVTFAWPLPR